MFGMISMARLMADEAHGEREPSIVESGRGGDGERYVLNGRIGPYWIAGLHVRISLVPGVGEPVTLKLHGVGQFLGRVNRVNGERIRLTFDPCCNDVAELVRVIPLAAN